MQFLEKEFLGLFNASSGTPAPGEAERSALAADSLRASGRLRLQVRGESMLPILWPGDVVEIVSCSLEGVRAGEIVLGRNAHVGTVEGKVVRAHPSSRVGPESWSRPPPGLSR